jgi:precorrin-2 dehydrogenase/sirohydrochlorin ferrochelatase
VRYPLFLELRDWPVVVVGGGQVASRKIGTLLKAGAVVTVISPAMSKRFGKVRWVRRAYRRGDLRGARLVVAATNDMAVNERVCADAKRRGLLVNCIAPPAAGNFIVPALVRQGGITLAISTGGASPAFAKRLRLDLERFLGRRYPALLKRLTKERRVRRSRPTTHNG